MALIFILWGCNKSPVEILDRLPAPHLIPSPPDTALVEKGIDAVEMGDFIQLDWETGDAQNSKSYRIYRREGKSGEFAKIAEANSTIRSYMDSSDIKIGKRYYYYLTAVDDDDIESLPSDTLSYLLVEKAFLLSNTLKPMPIFSWQVKTIPEFYVLKLLEADTDRKIWVTRIRTTYGQAEQTLFNFDKSAVVDSLQKGIPYKWRIDIIGPAENSGSESSWKRFVIQ